VSLSRSNPLPIGSLRPETAADRPFLERLFASVRMQEMDLGTWPSALRESFLASQLEFQSRHYAAAYPDAQRWVVESGPLAIGRLYIVHGAQDIRVVDLSLLPTWRGAGLGTVLLERLQQEAAGAGKTLSLNVAMTNPAQRLYQRLGFVETHQDEVYRHLQWRSR